jgi:16S rRNA (cytosine967-C5)-methyltransferase
MLRFGHVKTAQAIITNYKGAVPLASYIKEFFKKDKKYGGRDRKYISHAVYCYYRLGHIKNTVSIEERLYIGLFLVQTALANIFTEVKPDWQQWCIQHENTSLQDKLYFLQQEGFTIQPEEIFVPNASISSTLTNDAVTLQYIQQPNTFFRVRPQAAIKKLAQKLEDISAVKINDYCYAIENNTDLSVHFAINKEIVIQDWASQQVAQYFPEINSSKIQVWDVCAGAGGKSLLAVDHYENVHILATDIRASILANYKTRIQEAGFKTFNIQTKDVSKSGFFESNTVFDLVICDVPCTGSGTWARTPEELYFFKSTTIQEFNNTQFQISSQTIKHIKPNGYLLYITCSIFKNENEDVVEKLLKENTSLQLVQSTIINGSTHKADSMFVALLQLK